MNRLKELREKKKVSFSQYHLSTLTGIAQNRISLIERGLAKPSEGEMKRIAEAMGIGVKEIFNKGDQ